MPVVAVECFGLTNIILLPYLLTNVRKHLRPRDRGKTRIIEIKPDVIADFTNLPFEDNSFYMVVFDPPHLKTLGATSWMAKKYGKLPKDWQSLIHDGFTECMRVLKPYGTLVFKWNESEIKSSEVLSAIPFKPLIWALPLEDRARQYGCAL